MDPFLLILIAVALMIGISVSILYYLEKTKSDRIQSIKESKTISSEDEAYNKVKNAQSIARILKRKGQDTEEASRILKDAESQIDKGNYVKAMNLAREAKNKLEKNKMNPPKMNKKEKREEEKKGYSVDELKEMNFEKDEEEMSERAKKMKKQQKRLQSLPENYLESKFELDIIREKKDKFKDNEDAQKYYRLAEKSFKEESYTDALKYSVKCKKAIGGKDLGLLAGQKIDKKKRETDEIKEKIKDKIPELSEEEEEIEEIQDESEEALKCPSCGHTAGPDDNFCSNCGSELEFIFECPNCGTEVDEEDNFCPKCGTQL